ncbi:MULTISPECIES: redox-sensing transcriptional repressor Rex [unclassified Treponema]|uniref:redox-sensing transcriptional repressor Rex n=1 Tax=unclassified Treponema TaxID=2638727 RepID=UPI0020A612E5|nr:MULTISPECIES: redox-sensing transcriptional repressor Rex [unclassified Treponema]UTC68277.1 redox-sensing transcriptional repressor Rex [Treponema sp. OMZ 789]UTC70998.1 redox-sensing transcriptional repressor Rex [Treponema sp. OMZ 790]UTC73739.1 redox-sensing transcriptional repressor Rex [Treponema sp. OMZ 791]
MTKQKVPAAPSVRRLPSYLQLIKKAEADKLEYISGTVIAEELELEPIQVRKDLTITGIVGKPKKGYPVKELIKAIEKFLGWNKQKKAFVIGAGSLGTALSGYQGLKEHGLEICAAFDSDKRKIGKEIHGLKVFGMDELEKKVKEYKPEIAILTVPSTYAQEASNTLVKAGFKAIWNFTNIKINVPAGVIVQKEDLSSGYAMLGVMMSIKK